MLYQSGDRDRVVDEGLGKGPETYRSAWRRDYARLIHSAGFRRLQGKTQVFPGHESDFYRNRLTHSLEVAQIGKSIAIRLNANSGYFRSKADKIDPEIVEFAGLAHDLGHPPFGHNGEEALDECMREHGGFEGNAQSLRIVSKLEKKITQGYSNDDLSSFSPSGEDLRQGLNLTYRSLASILKYDRKIAERASDRLFPTKVNKGYYAEDEDLVSRIKQNVLGTDQYDGKFKTIECSIMDVADDIAYSTYDLEDVFKAGFLSPMDLFSLDEEIYIEVAKTLEERTKAAFPEENFEEEWEIRFDPEFVRQILYAIFEEILFGVGADLQKTLRQPATPLSVKKMIASMEAQNVSRKLATSGYHRVKFTSSLIQQFLTSIEVVKDPAYKQMYAVRLGLMEFLYVEVLKNITFHAVIRSPGMQVVEYRGKDIVKAIFGALKTEHGHWLLPNDFRSICGSANEMLKMRTICDFIAGMTDRYAFEFYGRLYGANNLTVHKPL